jgi:hypothetical protein
MKKIILIFIYATSFAQIGHDGGDYLYEIDEGPSSTPTPWFLKLLIVVAILLYLSRKK